MKVLTREQIDSFLDYDTDLKTGIICQEDEGFIAVESTIGELSNLNVGTTCGTVRNKCFTKFNKFFNRKVRGWYSSSNSEVDGMFHIECNEQESEEIEELAGINNGSLRASGESLLNGFYEFEIE